MQRDPSCVFCRIATGEIPASIVHQDESTVAFLDASPLADAHLLVIPRGHYANLLELPEDVASELGRVLPALSRAVTRSCGAEGVNLLMNSGRVAGQVVMHAHVHVIPRRADDGLGYRWNAGSYPPGRADALAKKLREAMSMPTD